MLSALSSEWVTCCTAGWLGPVQVERVHTKASFSRSTRHPVFSMATGASYSAREHKIGAREVHPKRILDRVHPRAVSLRKDKIRLPLPVLLQFLPRTYDRVPVRLCTRGGLPPAVTIRGKPIPLPTDLSRHHLPPSVSRTTLLLRLHGSHREGALTARRR